MPESTFFIPIDSFKFPSVLMKQILLLISSYGKTKKKEGRKIEKFVQGQIALLLTAELGFKSRLSSTTYLYVSVVEERGVSQISLLEVAMKKGIKLSERHLGGGHHNLRQGAPWSCPSERGSLLPLLSVILESRVKEP